MTLGGSVQQGARSGWFVVRLDGTVVGADETARAITGAPDTQALLGRSWSSLVARGDEGIVSDALAAAAQGQAWQGRLHLQYLATAVLVEGDLRVTDSAYERLAILNFTEQRRPTPVGPRAEAPTVPPRQPGLAARSVVDDALREAGSDDAAARAALQALAGLVPFDWATVLRFSAEGADTSAEVIAVFPTALAGVAPGATWRPLGPAERGVWVSGEPSIEPSLNRDPADASPLARLAGFGLRARMAIPLYAGERLVACAVLYRRAAGFAPDEGIAAEETIRPLGRRLSRPPGEVETPSPPPVRAAAPHVPATQVPPVQAPPTQAPPPREAASPIPPEPRLERGEEPPVPAARRVGSERSDRATERLSTLGELVAGVAHELNNPLTAILGYAQILPSLDGPEHARALETMEREAERAARIVRNLLAFARQRPGRRGPVDIEDLVTRVVSLRRYSMEIDGVAVEIRFASAPEVIGDAAQLEEVVLNLLNNAHQALRERGGTITITTEEVNGRLRLSVADDGPGIPEALRPRVFEPFFTTRATGEGQGMGLATVYGIVTEHGGRVWVEASEAGGAKFIVELPGTGAIRAPRPVTPPTPVRPPAASLGETRILVVDDEEPVRALTAEVLSGGGYTVRSVGSAQEALNLLEREPFDLLVVDMRMPVLDGAALHDRVIERWPQLATRVVFMTGDPEAVRSERYRNRTGVHFLEKPFDTAHLLATIRSALGR